MLKFIVLAFFIVTITGCANQYPMESQASGDNSDLMSEKILIKSSNYFRLIELYKNELKKKENSDIRLKLAKAYIDSHDNESALFTLTPLVVKNKVDPEVFYLQGVAQYNLGKIDQAERSLKITLQNTPKNAKAFNMLGIIYADKGELDKARDAFNQARTLMYDDVTIKNNLALLDLIEGNYKKAAAILLPVYLNSRGKVDSNVKANLAIIMAKLGSFDYISTLYSDKYTKDQLLEIYNDLKTSEPTDSRVSLKAAPSNVISDVPLKPNPASASSALVEHLDTPEPVPSMSNMTDSLEKSGLDEIKTSTLENTSHLVEDNIKADHDFNKIIDLKTVTKKDIKTDLPVPFMISTRAENTLSSSVSEKALSVKEAPFIPLKVNPSMNEVGDE